MDILAALEQSKADSETTKSHEDDYSFKNYEDNIHHVVMDVWLTRFGCSAEIIQDVLLEPANLWDYYLNYFEEKHKCQQ